MRSAAAALLIRALLGAFCAWVSFIQAQTPPPAAQALRERFASVRTSPDRVEFKQPLYLESSEASDRLRGDVYALVAHRFGDVRQALVGAGPWCDILILHLNVKYCRPERDGPRTALNVGIGRKFDQPLKDAYWVRFDFRVAADEEGYLAVGLQAPRGPLSTKDYRIVVEVAPYDERHSVLHMGYSYSYGLAARLAMDAYLATLGRGKVGFSVVGQAGGRPEFVRGVRGVVERNTMRYYLAIDSFLDAQALPAGERQSRSFRDWFDATERYPAQLHEIGRDEYLDMKANELRRQRTEIYPPPGG